MYYANQSWQMSQGPLLPDAPYYDGYYFHGYAPPYPPHGSSGVMYPFQSSHGHNSMGYYQYPSHHSQLSSAEESAASLSSGGRHNKRRSSKKRGKEKKNLRTTALAGDNHESISLLTIKGELFVFSNVQNKRIFQSSRPTFARLPFRAGRVVKVAKDQDGSRLVQQRLAVADSDEVQLVFEEVMPAIEGKSARVDTGIINCFSISHVTFISTKRIPCRRALE